MIILNLRFIFASYFLIRSSFFGELAQLARALRWQRRGDRFESDILHKKNPEFTTQDFLLHKPAD